MNQTDHLYGWRLAMFLVSLALILAAVWAGLVLTMLKQYTEAAGCIGAIGSGLAGFVIALRGQIHHHAHKSVFG